MSIKSTLMALGLFVGVSTLFGPSAFAQSTTESVTVQPGDTLSAIAEANGTDYVRLFNANDIIVNPDVIDVDQVIRIPAPEEQLPDRYGEFVASIPVAPVAQPAPVNTVQQSAPVATEAPVATTPAPVASATYSQGNVGNRYAWGNCTWYVYERKPNIGSFWGNGGYGWLSAAQADGFATGSQPVAGAIGVQTGHVVYVESVSGGDVTISEMNYAGGVGQVHYRTVPASTFLYIYA